MALTYTEVDKTATSASPKTYTVLHPFTPYDIIQTHAKLFNGADCEEWKHDIQDILYWTRSDTEITNDHLSRIDCLNLNKRTQLRDMLVRAGFVGEKVPEVVITEALVEQIRGDKWRLNIKLSNGYGYAVCDVSPKGLKIHRDINSCQVPFPVDLLGRIVLTEES